MITGLYGIKKVKAVDEKRILHYSQKYHIPLPDSYEIAASYAPFLKSLDTTRYSAQIKHHLQPLQALYFDQSGQLQSFHVNCNAGGFPNLAWDRSGAMASFPPKPQTSLDSILTLETHLAHMRALPQTQPFQAEQYDAIVIVHWSRFMGRQSKRLIRFVQANAARAADQKVKVIYANNDNVFAGQ